ncbi:MAG: hypothetical protein VX278_17665, partial [Myxococcota bacterium]|nr:hypothetical protein [Myxococcota bacterium]
GTRDYWSISPDVYNWGRWLVLVGAFALLSGIMGLRSEPYVLSPSLWVLTLLVGASWILSLSLVGIVRIVETPKDENPAPSRVPGWPDVMAHLVSDPLNANIATPKYQYSLSELDFTDTIEPNLVSPLLLELLPSYEGEPIGRLTKHQAHVVSHLSEQACKYEKLIERKKRGIGALEVDLTFGKKTEKTGWLVLLPEGYGKTTTGLLLACNHFLMHSERTIYITRSKEQVERLHRFFIQSIQPTTLRWNVRFSKCNGDFFSSIATEIYPEVLLISLEELSTELLNKSSLDAFFKSVGQVIVDDAESFVGPVEQHAQFTLRRLKQRLKNARYVESMSDIWNPIFVGLGCDAMHDMKSWATALFSHDLEVYHPDTPLRSSAPQLELLGEVITHACTQNTSVSFVDETGEEQASAPAEGEDEDPALSGSGREIFVYSLNDFGPNVGLKEIIRACEDVLVPWSFRYCGDAYRHLGLSTMRLKREPLYFRNDITDACVLLIRGNWVHIQKELERLHHFGHRFHQFYDAEQPAPEKGFTPLVVIYEITFFEENYFSVLQNNEALEFKIEELPRPVVRKPGHWVMKSHLASDLPVNWTEVNDLVFAFGKEVGQVLLELQNLGLIMIEERRELQENDSEYSNRLLIRAMQSAVLTHYEPQSPLLPPALTQVDVASNQEVILFDETSQRSLGITDGVAAFLQFYIGKMWVSSHGIFTVSSYDYTGNDQLARVCLEPMIENYVSSPKRRLLFDTPPSVDDVETRLFAAYPIGLCLLSWTRSQRAESRGTNLRHEPIGTLLLDAITLEIEERRIFRKKETETLKKQALKTDTLWLYPVFQIPEEDNLKPAELSLGAARLLTAAFRFLLPNIYRDAEHALGVALHLAVEDIKSVTRETPMGTEDAIVFFDLQQDGNGASAALYREGIHMLLLATLYFFQTIEKTELFMRLYDHWPDWSEIAGQEGTSNWDTTVSEAITWLARILGKAEAMPEDPTPEGPTGPSVPTDPGPTSPPPVAPAPTKTDPPPTPPDPDPNEPGSTIPEPTVPVIPTVPPNRVNTGPRQFKPGEVAAHTTYQNDLSVAATEWLTIVQTLFSPSGLGTDAIVPARTSFSLRIFGEHSIQTYTSVLGVSVEPKQKLLFIMPSKDMNIGDYIKAIAKAIPIQFKELPEESQSQLWLNIFSHPDASAPPLINETVIGGYAKTGIRNPEYIHQAIVESVEIPSEISHAVELPTGFSFSPMPPTGEVSGAWHNDLATPPRVKDDGFEFFFRNIPYRLGWGFESETDKTKYLQLMANAKGRAGGLWNYLSNDAYTSFLVELAKKLLALYGGKIDNHFSEFLLVFIQKNPYILDPDRKGSDWPRVPSEYFINNGGDCEDSSIAFLLLCRFFDLDSVLVNMEGHAATAATGPFIGCHYEINQQKYFYSETACKGFESCQGTAHDHVLEDITLPPFPLLMFAYPSVRIIKLYYDWDTKTLSVALVSDKNIPLNVVMYVRWCDNERDPVPATPFLSKTIPTKNGFYFEGSMIVERDLPNFPGSGKHSAKIDMGVWSDGALVGYWLSVFSMTISS